MKTVIEMAREAGLGSTGVREGFIFFQPGIGGLERFAELVRADERQRFYGQDRPAECANGCIANQICDYCQIVAPVKAMIAAERERFASECIDLVAMYGGPLDLEAAIRSRSQA